ncbi:hypothetical protein QTL95_20285 [Rhizobium sp. S152]|uniref:hypothetical protein n=1 Tax=Rhizobium sp. S152 TaxID=3055038 RepID=UPI0025AA17D7|nr:hypothetical protein [Rhizobium sp. S152]MDM9628236.1 hypothetical protein [Rhizobium sp. S152]
MDNLRYIFDSVSEKAIFYQSGDFLFPIGGNKAAYWIDGEYVFPVGAPEIAFWVMGNELFRHLGNGELTREPVYYIGD